MDVAAPNYLNTQIHVLLSIKDVNDVKDVNISETKRAIRNPLVVKQPEFQNAKTQRNPAIKKSATKKWILSGSHHGLNTRRSQWTKSGGSKGLQLEIAAHVVLYVRGIGWDVSSLLIFPTGVSGSMVVTPNR